MKLAIIFTSILAIYSCSTNRQSFYAGGPKKLGPESIYYGGQNTRTILPDIPDWANYSSSGQCLRRFRTKRIDMGLVKGKENLTYEQTLQLQLVFNQLYRESTANSGANHIPQKKEEKLFQIALSKVKNNFRALKLPKINRVHLVWIDPLLNSNKKLGQFKSLMNSQDMARGEPYFFSMCLNWRELNLFLADHNLEEFEGRGITIELLGIYSNRLKTNSYLQFDAKAFFGKKAKIYFYRPKGASMPSELKGPVSKKWL